MEHKTSILLTAKVANVLERLDLLFKLKDDPRDFKIYNFVRFNEKPLIVLIDGQGYIVGHYPDSVTIIFCPELEQLLVNPLYELLD